MKRWVKWVVFGVGFLMFLLLSEHATALSDRAIVIGLGVDRTEGQFEVSVQVLVASNGEKNANGSAVVTQTGETISGALSEIAQKTGLMVALSHCNLVILGQGVMDGYAFTTLDYLRRNAYLSENALLLGADRAKDVLQTQAAFGQTASFYAQRALIAYGNFAGIARKTVKEFLISYYTHGGGNWLTLMRPLPVDSYNDPSEQSGGQKSLYDLTHTAIFRKGQMLFTTTPAQTLGLNLFNDPLERGALTVEGDQGEKIEVYILKGNSRKHFDPEKLQMGLEIRLTLLLKEVLRTPAEAGAEEGDGRGDGGETQTGGEGEADADAGTADNGRGDGNPMTRSALSKTEEQRLSALLEDCVRGVFERAREAGADLFDCYGGYYRAQGKEWEQHAPADFLNKTTLQISTEFRYE